MKIYTKKELSFYIGEDAKRNGCKNYFSYLFMLFLGLENACAYRYLRCLRKCEYHFNNSSNSFYHKCCYYWYKIRLSQLGRRYMIQISLNTCGYGLRLIHLTGGGILLNVNRVGNYCGFNSGVVIGNKDVQEARPTIGDHVAFGPGSKAFGKITIGDNVFVAPNAVVTKDIPSDCVVGGVPAKVIKQKNR